MLGLSSAGGPACPRWPGRHDVAPRGCIVAPVRLGSLHTTGSQPCAEVCRVLVDRGFTSTAVLEVSTWRARPPERRAVLTEPCSLLACVSKCANARPIGRTGMSCVIT
jgi:hypothetical protein